MKLKPGDTVLVEATVVSAFNGYANVRIDAVNFAGEARRPLGGFVPFERIKRSEVCGSEDGKDAGREPYRVGKGIDEQLIYKNNELYAELEDAREAERVCNLLNEQHRKEQNND